MDNQTLAILAGMPKKINNFIQVVYKQASVHGVKININTTKNLEIDGIRVGGYFDSDNRILAFEYDRDDVSHWLAILVHEYSHMLQWINKRKFWNRLTNQMKRIDHFLNGKNVSGRQADRANLATMRIEYDNEKQTLALIKKHQLEEWINPDEYIQKANAYIIFHHIIRKYKKFYPPGHAPYTIESIWRHMPTSFDYDIQNPGNEYIDILDDYYKKLFT